MPFNVDKANPADDDIVSQYPANERASRTATEGWMDFEHDAGTGRHKIPRGTSATRDAIADSDWSEGSLWINTDSAINVLQVQVDTDPATNGTDWQRAVPLPTQYVEPAGIVKEYAGQANNLPAGYLLCDGAAKSRTTYAALFAVLGTTYGAGDGSTTFNVPDDRERVVAGLDPDGSVSRLTDQSGGVDGDTLGDTGGAETHLLTAAESGLPSHIHPANDQNSIRQIAGDDDDGIFIHQTAGNTGANNSAPASQAHNNVQPTIVRCKIISTGGV